MLLPCNTVVKQIVMTRLVGHLYRDGDKMGKGQIGPIARALQPCQLYNLNILIEQMNEEPTSQCMSVDEWNKLVYKCVLKQKWIEIYVAIVEFVVSVYNVYLGKARVNRKGT